MGYSRFVEIGRVAMINYGDDYGKLCVIMDVLDHNRVRTFPPSHAVCRSAPLGGGGGRCWRAALLTRSARCAVYGGRADYRCAAGCDELQAVIVDGDHGAGGADEQDVHGVSLPAQAARRPYGPAAGATPHRCAAPRRQKKLEALDTPIQEQFDATSWGQKLTRKKLRSELSDFGRFKVSIAKQKVRAAPPFPRSSCRRPAPGLTRPLPAAQRNKDIAKKVAQKVS